MNLFVWKAVSSERRSERNSATKRIQKSYKNGTVFDTFSAQIQHRKGGQKADKSSPVSAEMNPGLLVLY